MKHSIKINEHVIFCHKLPSNQHQISYFNWSLHKTFELLLREKKIVNRYSWIICNCFSSPNYSVSLFFFANDNCSLETIKSCHVFQTEAPVARNHQLRFCGRNMLILFIPYDKGFPYKQHTRSNLRYCCSLWSLCCMSISHCVSFYFIIFSVFLSLFASEFWCALENKLLDCSVQT